MSTRPSASGTPGSSESAAPGPRLIVLADGIDGGLGLWAVDMNGHWTALGATPNATALGLAADDVAVATGQQIDLRPGSDLGHPGRSLVLSWAGQTSSGHIAGLDQSSGGKLALVAADGVNFQYALADTAGKATALVPAPPQSFAPLIGWLDETRVVVLTMNKGLDSVLAVVDTTAHTMEPALSYVGVTAFGLSADRTTIATAMGNGVYAGPLAAFTGAGTPQQVMLLDGSQTVWGIAPDSDGARVFTLSGAVGQDGKIASIHELGYARQGSTWAKILDSAAPFSQALGQVYLPS